MNAVFFEKHGGPEVLQYGPFKDPIPAPDEVLIGVKACALNHLDIWVRQGLPVVAPMPHIPGSDVCGVVLECGKGVRHLQAGQRVIVAPGQLPVHLAEAFAARDSYCPEFRILGLQVQGGYAEKVAVHERFAVPVSDKLTDEQWASVPLAALTAWHMLVTRASLKAGETVLVHAAGSGIGSFAVQIARSLGATVYATAGDPGKVERAKKLGAAEVILYKTRDFAEEGLRLTGGRGVDVVFEHIGPETWPGNFKCMVRGGRMAVCGVTSGPKVEVDLRTLYSKQFSILGAFMGSLAELHQVLELVERGVIAPVVDQVFPLKEAADSHRRMESRRNFGKIVLKI